MKKYLTYSLLLILLCAFQCDDEPLEGEFGTGETTDDCELAVTNTANALLAFSNASDDEYTSLCNFYRDTLEAQIAACGDGDGSLQQAIDELGDCTLDPDPSGFNCNGVQLSDAIGNNFECDYSTYDNLVVNNVYLQENYVLTDEDNDGTDDHSLVSIFITDGTAELDANNEFVAYSTLPTYVLELVLFSLGTDGLAADNYMSFAMSNPATESYFSVVGTNLSSGTCNVNFIGCEDTEFTILEGIMSVTGTPGNFEVCFDMVSNNNNACIKGVYNNFIPIVTP